MVTMRDAIINRINVHIEMHQESIDSLVDNIEATDEDETIEGVMYEIKRVRTLKSLRIVLDSGEMPSQGTKEDFVLRDVIEEMMDLDV